MSAAPSRGRPTAVDRDALARTAIALFEERGYEAVSMSDVADAAGVGRRTLFRHFPTKAELVWDGFAPVQTARDEVLDLAASDDPLEALAQATRAGIAVLPELGLTRTRLRLIAAHPELIAFGSGRLHAGSLRVREFLASRGLDPLDAAVIADAFTTATFDAYVHWATATTDATPAACLDRALALIVKLRP